MAKLITDMGGFMAIPNTETPGTEYEISGTIDMSGWIDSHWIATSGLVFYGTNDCKLLNLSRPLLRHLNESAQFYNITIVDPVIDITYYYYDSNYCAGALLQSADNLVLENCHVQGGSVHYVFNGVGALVGGVRRSLIMKHCTNNTPVSGRAQVGGLIGYAFNAVIEDCENSGAITTNDEPNHDASCFKSYTYAGGIVGRISNNISSSSSIVIGDCKNYADINGKAYIGGIAGGVLATGLGFPSGSRAYNLENHGKIQKYDSDNNQYNQYFGGIFGTVGGGKTLGSVSQCNNYGEIDGVHFVGGIIGSADTSLTDCHNYNTVTGMTTIGGVCGNADSSSQIEDCSNEGEVTCDAVYDPRYMGGIVGQENACVIENCQSNGPVIGNSAAVVGGISGYGIVSRPITNNKVSAELTGGSVGGVFGIIPSNDSGSNVSANEFTGRIIAEHDAGGVTAILHPGINPRAVEDGSTIIEIYDNRIEGDIESEHGPVGGVVGFVNGRGKIQRNMVLSDRIAITSGDAQDYGAGGIVGEILVADMTTVGGGGGYYGYGYGGNPDVSIVMLDIRRNCVEAGLISAPYGVRRIIGIAEPKADAEETGNVFKTFDELTPAPLRVSNNYALPGVRLAGDNSLDPFNPGVDYDPAGAAVDPETDPDYRANHMNGMNPIVLPDSFQQHAECYNDDVVFAAHDGGNLCATQQPAVRRTPARGTRADESGSFAIRSITDKITQMYQQFKDIGIRAAAGNCTNCISTSAASNLIRDEKAIRCKLCAITDALAKCQSFSSESSDGKKVVYLSAACTITRLTANARYVVTNRQTGDSIIFASDGIGIAKIRLEPGEYSLIVRPDEGSGAVSDEVRTLIVTEDDFFISGDMECTEGGSVCKALLPCSQ